MTLKNLLTKFFEELNLSGAHSSRTDQGSPCNLSLVLLEAGVRLEVSYPNWEVLAFLLSSTLLHSPNIQAATRGEWQKRRRRRKRSSGQVTDIHWEVGLRLGFVKQDKKLCSEEAAGRFN